MGRSVRRAERSAAAPTPAPSEARAAPSAVGWEVEGPRARSCERHGAKHRHRNECCRHEELGHRPRDAARADDVVSQLVNVPRASEPARRVEQQFGRVVKATEVAAPRHGARVVGDGRELLRVLWGDGGQKGNKRATREAGPHPNELAGVETWQ